MLIEGVVACVVYVLIEGVVACVVYVLIEGVVACVILSHPPGIYISGDCGVCVLLFV